MKKIIISLAVLVTLLLITAILIPIIFKDDIQNGIRQAINENTDAEIYYDPTKFGLSLFKSFPNPTASIEEFGIVGVNQFDGDTLLSVKSFNITIDLFSLFGDSYSVKSINLQEPNINIIVLQNGDANYQIITESEIEEPESMDGDNNTSDFNLSIDHWNLSDGKLSYIDRSLDFYMVLDGLNHTGSGNLSLNDYDLVTLSTVEKSMMSYEGIKYLTGQKLFADATLNINIPEFKFTFKNNMIRVNDFPVTFAGYFAMPFDDMEMDISFSSTNSSLKSLYSLIPGVYTEGYENIYAEGDMSFSGYLRGIYNDDSMPAYNLSLQASDGVISYPDLPTPIKNINIDMLVDCKDGNIDNTRIEINKFNMNMGSNPIGGSLLVRNLKDYSMKANVSATLDLAELGSVFPIEGLDMKGIFSVKFNADGKYDSAQNIIPVLSANMSMKNGYLKSNELPRAIDKLSFASTIDCPSGNMKDMTLKVENFFISMGGKELNGRLLLSDLVDYKWDLKAKGDLDLEVISEVYPVEGMKFSGILSTDIETKGMYSDVEAERYDRFPTIGKIALTDFKYLSDELPQGVHLKVASIFMNPRQLQVESFNGTIGNSDMKLTGVIKNYIDYIFSEQALLQGEMELSSNVLDINEWMTGEETTVENSSDTVDLDVVVVPRNIDFKFISSIKNIYYDNLNLQNASGMLFIQNGILDMSNLSFNLLGGTVIMNGKYDTRIPNSPVFSYQLNVKSLSISDAFASFSTVQAFAPMAKHMNGDFSTNFNISGLLDQKMSPVYESLNGKGLIQIAEASIKESKLVSGISGFMKSDLNSNQLTLKNVIMKTSLENGRAHVSPFDVAIGGQKAKISGSIGADGSLDYYVSTEVEAGAIGQQVNQLLAGLQGQDASETSSKIKLNFNVGGTYDQPKILLAGTTSSDGKTTRIHNQVKNNVKKEVDASLDSVKQEAEQKIQDETAKLMKQGEEKLQQQLDTLKKGLTKNLEDEAGKALNKEMDSTTEELTNSLKNLFKKKSKEKNK